MISARQYRRFLEALDMSQTAAARIFDLDPRTSRRYALDESNVPEAINIALRLMIKYKLTPNDIARLTQERLL